jgi:ribosomal protein L11 methylase PrmA
MAATGIIPHPASYRDPCGFVFEHSGIFYRAVLAAGREDYDALMQSGLYQQLVERNLMIAHEEVADLLPSANVYKMLKPEQLGFWTYPYEWSFSQLRDAALLTLKLIRLGLEHGMILKDASANNIQFVSGHPVLIDSLSFEAYEEGRPWQAFNQFCRHFLYPLLVFQKHPEWTPATLMAYPDGLSAPLTASLLPWKSRFSWNKQLYVYLAAALGKKKSGTAYRISKEKILQNTAQLKDFIGGLQPPKVDAGWSHYYDETILSEDYLESKKAIVADVLKDLGPKRVIDTGCNTGAFSLITAEYAPQVIAFDADASSVDALYTETGARNMRHIHTLVADLTNPTPALGWANAERSALKDRLRGDMVLALALAHHLAIGKNVPFSMISSFFAGITQKWLLIEFVPKSDPRVQLLLQSREDVFVDYTQQHFEGAFSAHFSFEKTFALPHSERILYLMRRR